MDDDQQLTVTRYYADQPPFRVCIAVSDEPIYGRHVATNLDQGPQDTAGLLVSYLALIDHYLEDTLPDGPDTGGHRAASHDAARAVADAPPSLYDLRTFLAETANDAVEIGDSVLWATYKAPLLVLDTLLEAGPKAVIDWFKVAADNTTHDPYHLAQAIAAAETR